MGLFGFALGQGGLALGLRGFALGVLGCLDTNMLQWNIGFSVFFFLESLSFIQLFAVWLVFMVTHSLTTYYNNACDFTAWVREGQQYPGPGKGPAQKFM